MQCHTCNAKAMIMGVAPRGVVPHVVGACLAICVGSTASAPAPRAGDDDKGKNDRLAKSSLILTKRNCVYFTTLCVPLHCMYLTIVHSLSATKTRISLANLKIHIQ